MDGWQRRLADDYDEAVGYPPGTRARLRPCPLGQNSRHEATRSLSIRSGRSKSVCSVTDLDSYRLTVPSHYPISTSCGPSVLAFVPRAPRTFPPNAILGMVGSALTSESGAFWDAHEIYCQQTRPINSPRFLFATCERINKPFLTVISRYSQLHNNILTRQMPKSNCCRTGSSGKVAAACPTKPSPTDSPSSAASPTPPPSPDRGWTGS